MGGNGRAPSERATPNELRAARELLEGADGLGPERVAEIQRARILAAMAKVCVERGASANVTVARAGVSRRTFYELLTDREDCFLAALDEWAGHAYSYVLDASESSLWADRIRGALGALLTFFDAESDAAWLLVVGSLGAGERGLERRRRVLAKLILLVDEGRQESKAGSQLPPLTAEGFVGGALSVVHAGATHQLARTRRVSQKAIGGRLSS